MRSKLIVFALVATLAVGVAAAQANQLQITQGPKVEHVTADTAIIAWSTNVNAGSTVKYGTDANNLDKQAGAPWGGLTHRVTIKGLEPNKTYYFQVVSGEAQGSGARAMSDVVQFQTKAGQSTNPNQNAQNQGQQEIKIVAGPIPQKVLDTTARVWWQTTAPSETILKYGTERGRLDQTAMEAWGKGGQSHRVELKNLKPDTTYYLEIQDEKGNVRREGQFKTYPQNWAKDRQLDIIGGPMIEYIGHDSAVIAWSTNQKSSTVVRYGTDPNSLTQTAQAPWGGGGDATHRVTIRGLKPNTQYWFSIESAQAQGTGSMAQSQKFPFQTVENAQASMRINPQQQ